MSDNFIQHNPGVADGKQALIDVVDFLTNLEGYSQTIQISRTLVYGDFAVVHAKWTDPDGTYAVFDILRFDENYKIVEHWDAFGKPIPEDNTNPRDPVF